MSFLHTKGRCELLGGPLDGVRYGDLPILEDGLAPASLSCPLSQPAELSIYADYERRDAHALAGVWVYVFTGLSGPGYETNAVARQRSSVEG